LNDTTPPGENQQGGLRMSLHEKLIDLDTALCELSRNVNAAYVMSLGLAQARDSYADGFAALSIHLLDADREVRKRLNDCLNTI